MKLSAKKRGEIIDEIQIILSQKREKMRKDLGENLVRNYVDNEIGHLLMPIAHKVFKIFDKDYK
jgi:hypothetical protein